MYKAQIEPCKHCGYQEYDPPNGGMLATYYTVEKISKEPIKAIGCVRCKKEMQLYYQEHHRRFYRCWNCNNIDVDTIFYESEQFEGINDGRN